MILACRAPHVTRMTCLNPSATASEEQGSRAEARVPHLVADKLRWGRHYWGRCKSNGSWQITEKGTPVIDRARRVMRARGTGREARAGLFVRFDTARQREGVMQVLPIVPAPKRVCNFPGPCPTGAQGVAGGIGEGPGAPRRGGVVGGSEVHK